MCRNQRYSLACGWTMILVFLVASLAWGPSPSTALANAIYISTGALIAWAALGAWWNWRQAHAT